MILLDASFIVSYLDYRDQNHGIALDIQKNIDSGRYGGMVMTDYVFDEVATVMLMKIKKASVVSNYCERLLNVVNLVNLDDHLFMDTLNIFKYQKNNKLSFTDCANVAVCRVNGIRNIATFDKEFTKFDELSVVSK